MAINFLDMPVSTPGSVSSEGLLVARYNDGVYSFNAYMSASGVGVYGCVFPDSVGINTVHFITANTGLIGYTLNGSNFGEHSINNAADVGIYYDTGTRYTPGSTYTWYYTFNTYSSLADAVAAFKEEILGGVDIVVAATNCIVAGPDRGRPNQQLQYNIVPNSGYVVKKTGISVYNSSGSIPFTLTNGTLRFTVP